MNCIQRSRGGENRRGQNLGLPSLWVTERAQFLSHVFDDYFSEILGCTHPHGTLQSLAQKT